MPLPSYRFRPGRQVRRPLLPDVEQDAADGSIAVFRRHGHNRYSLNSKQDVARNLEKVYTLFPRVKERHSQVAGTLSGGEQQMLATGRALMANPRILLMDEPSMGLSPLLVEEIFRAQALCQG